MANLSHEWIIRAETSADFEAIDALIASASSEKETVQLVRDLRRDGYALISLVAEWECAVVGHIMMSRMCFVTDGREVAAVALAPLMVDPASQKHGIGSELTQQALQQCRDRGESMVFVLGHPTYYPRFGFSSTLGEHFQIPFKLSIPGAFMVLELTPGPFAGLRGRVKYAPPFGLSEEWTMSTRVQ